MPRAESAPLEEKLARKAREADARAMASAVRDSAKHHHSIADPSVLPMVSVDGPLEDRHVCFTRNVAQILDAPLAALRDEMTNQGICSPSSSSSSSYSMDVCISYPTENIDEDREALILAPLLETPSLFTHPGFFPGVECKVGKVEVDDPREALQGHNGEKAAFCFVLYPYSCTYSLTRSLISPSFLSILLSLLLSPSSAPCEM